MPINYKEYPANWGEIRDRILLRAKNKCEECGLINHSIVARGNGKKTKIVLTIAHLDHDKLNHDVKDERLKALCQKCHLAYDLPRHIANRKYGRNHQNNNYKLDL